MGLKRKIKSKQSKKGKQSQSNHYGIETVVFMLACPKTFWVAIEPLWDWNARSASSKSTLKKSQSNHYGIETARDNAPTMPIIGRNRTIMGLKPIPSDYLITCISGRNRTIMGLKHQPISVPKFYHVVAIEPLWDWNRDLHLQNLH